VYPRRRRHPHALLGTVVALALAGAAFAGAPRLLAWTHPTRSIDRVPGTARVYLPTVGWPQQGQAALVIGNGRPAASPNEAAVPIASLAKVMTAYLTLERYPLSGNQDGFTVTITAAEAQEEVEDAAEGQSGAAVAAGERLTERELLEALLVPSGNNIAQILADQIAGSEAGFVDEMNNEARALGMDHTFYTDPSGFDPTTVSTAADQLRIFRRAMRFAVFRQIVSMASVTLPAAGTLTNFNPLVADGYGGKTGSDSAAGGCLAFFTNVTIDARRRTVVGVVLGQGQGNDTSMLLAAAAEAARQLVASAVPATRASTQPAGGASGDREPGASSP